MTTIVFSLFFPSFFPGLPFPVCLVLSWLVFPLLFSVFPSTLFLILRLSNIYVERPMIPSGLLGFEHFTLLTHIVTKGLTKIVWDTYRSGERYWLFYLSYSCFIKSKRMIMMSVLSSPHIHPNGSNSIVL